jgi:beta-glucosidase
MTTTPSPSRVDELVAAMTLDEQASLTGGRDVWHLPAVARLGIGAMRMSDGPSGVRGAEMGTKRSLSFPCGLAAGATWDVDLIGRYGVALGDEAQSKDVNVLLGPTVCIPRTPLGGRTFESFAEDPHLSSRLTVAYIRGVQSRGVACCVKHFAANDQEHERMSISVELDERTLREVHLAPFEVAVIEAGTWSIMGAYNRLRGTYCCEHDVLLGRILKEEWGFDGVVVSDWMGTRSTAEAALAGLDVEMPGPPSFLGAKLAAAVEVGEIDAAVVAEHARRVVRLAERTGAIGAPEPGEEREEDDPSRRALARELAVGGTVLLRNEGAALPLDIARTRRVALIGANALALQLGGGGSSQVTPLRQQSIAAELRNRLPGVELLVEQGCGIDRGLPPMPAALLDGGIAVELFAGADQAVGPAVTTTLHSGTYIAFGEPVPGVNASTLSARATATFTPDVSGSWQIGMASVGAGRLYFDDELIADNSDLEPGDRFFGFGRAIVSTHLDLMAGSTHSLRIETGPGDKPIAGFEIVASRPVVEGALAAAVAAAVSADVAVVVVGSNSQWETEGEDRKDLHLVGEQDALVTAVAAANPRTVVVVNNGGPLEMPWVDDVAAVLELWYPGEEGAAALADVLTGIAEPGGRLPVTFPRRLADSAPAASTDWYPGADGKVVYGEGLLLGHRHYDAHDIEPLFPFGHGLSYTTFAFGPPTVDGAAPTVTVGVPMTNTGSRRGSEVVQVYVEPLDRTEGRPVRHLGGFAKVTIEAGATATAEIALGETAFRAWDDTAGGWTVPAGAYRLRIGTSSRNLPHTLELTVP